MPAEAVPSQPADYGKILAANVRAERNRADLTQADVAKRMRRLGCRWHFQTVGAIERGERPLSAYELAALAVVLDAEPAQLALPPPGVTTVLFGEQPVPAVRLSVNDGSVIWDGDTLKIGEDAGTVPQAALRALRLAGTLARHTGGDVELAEPPSPDDGEET